MNEKQRPKKNKKICLKMKDSIRIIYNQYALQININNQDPNQITFKNIDCIQPLEQQIRNFIQPEQLPQKQQSNQLVQFEQIYGIITLSKKTYLILTSLSHQVGIIKNYPIYKADQFKFVEISNITQSQPLLVHLQRSFKLLSFYYSTYNLTERLEFKFQKPAYFQHSFFCNFKHTLSYSDYPIDILTRFIFGFAQTKTFTQNDKQFNLTLISRGNFNSMGRRWFRRGLLENSYVSNHFESEFILQIVENNNQTNYTSKRTLYSSIQTRGSMPLLWNQTPTLGIKAPYRVSTDSQKIQRQLRNYLEKQEALQKQVKMINLIGKFGPQGRLGQCLTHYVMQLQRQKTSLLWFDFHSAVRYNTFNKLIQLTKNEIQRYGFCKISKKSNDYDYQIQKQQRGTFRTNCIDCIDRTNCIQYIICKTFLQQMLDEYQGREQRFNRLQEIQLNQFEDNFRDLWINNGNELSLQSSGSQVMILDFYDKRKRTFLGKFRDIRLGAQRYFTSNFADYYYQNCIDLHFKKIAIGQDDNRILGQPRKKISLAVSIVTVAGISWVVYNYIYQSIKEESKRKLASISGSIITGLLGFFAIKRNSQYFVQLPINRVEYL